LLLPALVAYHKIGKSHGTLNRVDALQARPAAPAGR
jgi:hypothetical protein